MRKPMNTVRRYGWMKIGVFGHRTLIEVYSGSTAWRGVWEPYEEEENPDPPREYAKNELPEWIKPNPDDAEIGIIRVILDMFGLFISFDL